MASTPAAARDEQRTGRPIAIASRILFWVPRAMRNGAMLATAPCANGRTSGTVPVTITPGNLPSARMSAGGSAPMMLSVASGRRARTKGSTSRQNAVIACWLGK